jgi:hypothetical protein
MDGVTVDFENFLVRRHCDDVSALAIDGRAEAVLLDRASPVQTVGAEKALSITKPASFYRCALALLQRIRKYE